MTPDTNIDLLKAHFLLNCFDQVIKRIEVTKASEKLHKKAFHLLYIPKQNSADTTSNGSYKAHSSWLYYINLETKFELCVR